MEDNYEEAKFNQDITGYSTRLENTGLDDHPVNHLEPLPEASDFNAGYRAAAKRFLYILNSTLAFIVEAESSRHASWQAAFALGSGICAGQSMNQVADTLGVTRASLSKGAKSFARSLDLPPSSYMKSEAATKNYRQSRLDSINEANIALRS